MQLLAFVITAAVAVAAAVMVVAEKNAVHAALYLILNIVSLAFLYISLGAEFVGAVQVIVYAGAIMVLFLYVVMFSGAAATPDSRDRLAWQKRIAVGGGLILVALMVRVLKFGGPRPSAVSSADGSPANIGSLLFTTYALPFEVASLLLLVAMVGAIVLAKGRRE
jgi:NADH-quinone oxidoreductase subunit J